MNENDDDHRRDDGIGPADIISALVAVGVFGGEPGQLVLSRLKRLAGVGALTFLAGTLVTPLFPRDFAGLWLTLCVGWSLIGLLFWCYAAVAKWLTRGGGPSGSDAP